MGQRTGQLSAATRLVICVRVVEQGWSITAAAAAAGCSRQTASKWVARFRDDGHQGIIDRSCRPHRIRTVSARIARRVIGLRLRDGFGSHYIAWLLGIARSTVHHILRRAGINKPARAPREPIVRYEKASCGELIHLDTKKLGKIRGVGHRFAERGYTRRHAGWEIVHLAIDDHSRLGYAEVLDDETGATTAAFLRRAISFFAAHDIRTRAILTDNGVGYVSRAFAATVAELGIRHQRTRAYRPQTNGKAEAFVKLLLRGWAYRRPYASSANRRRALAPWLRSYNHLRPHGGINGQRPIERTPVNNLPGRNT